MRKTKNKKKLVSLVLFFFFFFLGLTSARGGADVSNAQDTRVAARVGSGRVGGLRRVGGAWRVDLKQKEGRKLHRRVAARGALSGYEISGGASS